MAAYYHEQRKHARFVPEAKAFAVMRPDFSKVGRVVDISETGMCFEFMSPSPPSSDWTQVDIFFVDNGFYMHQVPCRVVYATRDNDKIQADEVGLYTHRCGLELGALTERHRSQLEMFLTQHVAGTA